MIVRELTISGYFSKKGYVFRRGTLWIVITNIALQERGRPTTSIQCILAGKSSLQTHLMIIDLTHKLKDNITVYPGTITPKFDQGNTIEKDGFAELNMTMCTHTGTHIDAPSHIIRGARSLDKFPVEKFIGKGVVVDCTTVTSIEQGHLMTYQDSIQNSEFVLFYTGWQDKWNTPHYFDPFPTLTTDAVKWLLNFELKALGFDAISVDHIDDAALSNHHLLLPREVLIIENMTNLDKLTGKEFELYCIPLFIQDSDGSPVRAFAEIL